MIAIIAGQRFLVALILLSAAQVTAEPTVAQSAEDARPARVSLCDVVAQPFRWHDRMVSFEAILAGGWERLHHPECDDPYSFIALKLLDRDDSILAGLPPDSGTSRWVEVTGRFLAPSGAGIGYLASFRQALVVHEAHAASAREVVNRVYRKEELIFVDKTVEGIVFSMNEDTLEKILTEDYRLVARNRDVFFRDDVLTNPALLLRPQPLALAYTRGVDLSWRDRTFVGVDTAIVQHRIELDTVWIMTAIHSLRLEGGEWKLALTFQEWP